MKERGMVKTNAEKRKETESDKNEDSGGKTDK